LIGGAALVTWFAAHALLLLFAAVLLGIFLHGLADWTAGRVRISYGWALLAVCIVLSLLVVLAFWFMAPRIADQVQQLNERLPRIIEDLRGRADAVPWLGKAIDDMPSPRQLAGRGDLLGRLTGVFSSTLGFLTNVVLMAFVALYLAANPGQYRRGLVRLFPPARRNRAREILDELGNSMWWWLLAKLASMIVVGMLTLIGLALLGIPLAFTLALLAFLLSFIPNIGPIISAVPALLLGLAESPQTALYVLLLYVAIQTLESYLLFPMFQQRAVDVPAALTIAAQVVLGLLLGMWGLALAAPLVAVVMVLVRTLYIEDVLRESSG
jgi:predicted PurR-regulated permease PerM